MDDNLKQNFERYKNNYYDKNNKLDIEILKEKINNELQKNNKIYKEKIYYSKLPSNPSCTHFNGCKACELEFTNGQVIFDYYPDKITLLEVMKETLDKYEEEKKEFIEEINHKRI
jgi:adenylate kinase family enzyme